MGMVECWFLGGLKVGLRVNHSVQELNDRLASIANFWTPGKFATEFPMSYYIFLLGKLGSNL